MLILVFNALAASFHPTGLGCTHLDMVGKHAGTFFGISNTICNLSGFLVPLIAGFLTDGKAEDRMAWMPVWTMVTITQFSGAAVFWIFGDVTLQKWVLDEEVDETLISNDEMSG